MSPWNSPHLSPFPASPATFPYSISPWGTSPVTFLVRITFTISYHLSLPHLSPLAATVYLSHLTFSHLHLTSLTLPVPQKHTCILFHVVLSWYYWITLDCLTFGSDCIKSPDSFFNRYLRRDYESTFNYLSHLSPLELLVYLSRPLQTTLQLRVL